MGTPGPGQARPRSGQGGGERPLDNAMVLFSGLRMRYVASYLLAALGGNASPSAKDIKKILDSVGIEADDDRLNKVAAWVTPATRYFARSASSYSTPVFRLGKWFGEACASSRGYLSGRCFGALREPQSNSESEARPDQHGSVEAQWKSRILK